MQTKIEKDSKNHSYMESVMINGESIRVSLIENGWDGGKCIRVQKKNKGSNRVNPGPEFPIAIIDEIVYALLKLKNEG